MKKDLENNARELRELEKEMKASFSGPLVSDTGARSGDAGLGFPRAQSLLARSGAAPLMPLLSVPSKV